MIVRIHIDRLVLDGLDVPHGSRTALGTALERELTRGIVEGGLAPSLLSDMAVPALGTPPISAAGSPRQLGSAIGGAVYRGIAGAPPPGGR